MIQARLQISGQINGREKLSGGLNTSIKEIKPELENIKIIPKTEQQEFKSEKYGYDKIIVEPVTSSIDKDIKSENIKKGINILGIEGGYEGVDTSDATATSNDILIGKTAYVNNKKIEGNIEEYDGSYSGEIAKPLIINDASHLFYAGARTNLLDQLLSLCKNLTSMYNMFYSCSNLTELDLSILDTSQVTNMTGVFYYCNKLTKLDLSNFNTKQVSSFNNMFLYCRKLTDLNLSSFDMEKAENINSFLSSCNELINLKSFKNLGKKYKTSSQPNYNNFTLDLSYCSKLTYESLIDVITNGLYDLNLTYDVANGGLLYTQKLILGTTNLEKLTAEEIRNSDSKAVGRFHKKGGKE